VELEDDFLGTRPAPPAAFRARLRHDLLAEGVPPSRPAHLRVLVGAYAACGIVMLLIAAADVAS
jgi:hypothetical protein